MTVDDLIAAGVVSEDATVAPTPLWGGPLRVSACGLEVVIRSHPPSVEARGRGGCATLSPRQGVVTVEQVRLVVGLVR